MYKYYFFILLLVLSCKKEDNQPVNDPVPSNEITLSEAVILTLDTSCIVIPNIFTPNGDGYNDLFFPSQKNIDSLHITIRNSNSIILFSHTGSFWDGEYNGNRVSGIYNYEIYVRTSSLKDSVIFGNVYLASNPSETCFSVSISPLLSDMIDVENCNFNFVTGEFFCVN